MSSSSQIAESWISSFCNLLGHEYFAEVSEDFIEDDFNLTGLQSQVPMYKEALEMILDVEPEDDEDDDDEEDEEDDDDEVLDDEKPAGYRRSDRRHVRTHSDISVVESSAELLYGLIHQRYITARPGIQQMAEKYELQHFGVCPRVYCAGAKVLPVGCSDTPGRETVKLFCPSCLDVYTPPNSRFQSVDGAFFGTTFGSLFFMTFPDLDIGVPRTDVPHHQVMADTHGQSVIPKSRTASLSSTTPSQLFPLPATISGAAPSNLAPGLGSGRIYEPRIYGFRVSEWSHTGPRMKWLRMRPADVYELDEFTQFHQRCKDATAPTPTRETQDDNGDGGDGGGGAGDRNGEEEGGREDSTMADAAVEIFPVATPRKKAGVRRRRTLNGATLAAGGRASPMDTNGTPEGV